MERPQFRHAKWECVDRYRRSVVPKLPPEASDGREMAASGSLAPGSEPLGLFEPGSEVVALVRERDEVVLNFCNIEVNHDIGHSPLLDQGLTPVDGEPVICVILASAPIPEQDEADAHYPCEDQREPKQAHAEQE